MNDYSDVNERLRSKLASSVITQQTTVDDIHTYWIDASQIVTAARYLKTDLESPFAMLVDLTAIDERHRQHRDGQPPSDFTVVYTLYSMARNAYLRIKVALDERHLHLPTLDGVWKNADWYEREVWDMFGICFDGHPNLRRILMPKSWQGHPLRKEYPARATEAGPYEMTLEKEVTEMDDLKFRPEEWGMTTQSADSDYMFLNLGPNHPGTHGVLRLILQLDGEEILDVVPDIGFHHRGAEKMGERQTWHTYIPYTDRIDYLSGVMNNLAYLLPLETLAGIEVPDRAKVIRIMLCELFRIASHLVWYGTFVQDIGVMSPVFYVFNDREKLLGIIQAICGARMHPNWFRIGGVAQDLPTGWQSLVRDFLDYMPGRLKEYDNIVMKNRLFQARTQGVGTFTADDAIEWGITGAGLRACGLEWDLRKARPYAGYDQFEFDVPIAQHGDCYDRAWVRIEEMRQSLRIIEQCVKLMPAGPYKSHHPATTPPLKNHTMEDIETLINHFLSVSWGPVMPVGESFHAIESSKGLFGFHLVSDGGTNSYRTRARTPSFAHMQMLPKICRGWMIPDLMAVLGAMDFVLADLDR